MKFRLDEAILYELPHGVWYDVLTIREYKNTSKFAPDRIIKSLEEFDIESFVNEDKYYEATLYNIHNEMVYVELTFFNVIEVFRNNVINNILK